MAGDMAATVAGQAGVSFVEEDNSSPSYKHTTASAQKPRSFCSKKTHLALLLQRRDVRVLLHVALERLPETTGPILLIVSKQLSACWLVCARVVGREGWCAGRRSTHTFL